MTRSPSNKDTHNHSYLKKVDATQKSKLVAIDSQQYEYIKRLLILYKAQMRQTGECHYPPLVEIVKQKRSDSNM